ncbi:MAG TPA: nucleoside kinase [Candidatus Merdenecus merdavium]|nr:nucleoside kinase [Candidatus Merdenecus merdavium]
MLEKTIKVQVGAQIKEYPVGTRYLTIAEDFQGEEENDIVLVLVNQRLRELHKKTYEDCNLQFITTGQETGNKAYKRSATLLLLKAIYSISGHNNIENVRIHYSLGTGYYCTIKGNITLDQVFLDRLKAKMNQLVEDDYPIMKRSVNTEDAIAQFKAHRMYDKEKLFHYRRVSKVNLYRLKGFEDYFYGFMVPSTKYLKYFDLYLYDEGFALQLPEAKAPKIVPEFRPQNKVFQVLKESTKWGQVLNVPTVGALNDLIAQGGIKQLILVQEALQEKKMAEIAEAIIAAKEKKFIMIAGPSSSGKTTFSHRLSIQLEAHGLKPHPIAVDDYFINREDTPIGPDGKHNFEALEAIDVEAFNRDMNELLEGKLVELPSYNFITGKREYNGKFKRLGPDDILVIEGIHCLNDRLSHSLPKESKFKIYISALTQLNVDEHNRIPSTDGRMIRRLVRDARTRGIQGQKTIDMWPSVRRGEESNIFPYQEEADMMFNSALIYELAVLKLYAEPILFSIGKNEPEYLEAKRLLKFLDYFIGIPSEDIPQNSILREFIGGSCFDV